MPIQAARLVAGTNSPTVGTSGSTSERVAVVTASARSLPALMYSIDDEHVGEHHLHLSADQIGECAALRRDMAREAMSTPAIILNNSPAM